jgi:hypothetical protein
MPSVHDSIGSMFCYFILLVRVLFVSVRSRFIPLVHVFIINARTGFAIKSKF